MKMLYDNVLIKPLEEKSSVLTPGKLKEYPEKGQVISAGPGDAYGYPSSYPDDDMKAMTVKKGDIVQVYKEGEEIKDPETNESLGNLEMPLSPEMIIISVMPRMSMAKVSEFYRDTVQSRINPFFYTGSRRKLPESIKVGDLVKNVE